ncbi:MAG TPA: alanine racemase [Longimicrobiales bacterium]|nr:alanine racemase [Longimicrobiales bacterium]
MESRAWIDVDLDAVRHNFDTIRRLAGPERAVIAVVKADGYGLGAERVVRALEPLAPWGYGVAAAAEGTALRAAGIRRPILLTAPAPPQCIDEAAAARLTLSISDVHTLDRWARAAERLGEPLDFHVEIDTGMGRAGFDWRTTAEWGPKVRARCGERVRWTGVFTHFHDADAAAAAPAATQWERFSDAVAQLPVSREDLFVHVANSAGVRWSRYHADGVRPGLYLYGAHPLAGTGAEAELPAPRPVASIRARVALVREVPPGTTVGYGATHQAVGWERWATLAIGYGDGLPRRLGNKAFALLQGRRVPVVGRISMDMTVVDVTAIPTVREGDVATLLGRDGDAEIRIEELAAQAETIPYEILTGLTPRLPRVERHGHGG